MVATTTTFFCSRCHNHDKRVGRAGRAGAGQQLGWPLDDAIGALGGGQMTAMAVVVATVCVAVSCVR
jgi:hypothetical protein